VGIRPELAKTFYLKPDFEHTFTTRVVYHFASRSPGSPPGEKSQEAFMKLTRSLFVGLLCTLMSFAAFAQSVNVTAGSIGGKVTDNSGAGLPGVTVTATNLDTGL